MSYDVHIGDECHGQTYNIAPMVSEAIGMSVSDWDGLPAGVVGVYALRLLKALAEDPAKYKAMNPRNNWGSRDSLMSMACNVLISCQNNPDCIVKVT